MIVLDVYGLTQINGLSLPLYRDNDGYVVVLLVRSGPPAKFTGEKFDTVAEAVDFCGKETGPGARLRREPVPLDLWEGPRTCRGVTPPGSDDVVEHESGCRHRH